MKTKYLLPALLMLAIAVNLNAGIATNKSAKGTSFVQPPQGGMQRTPEERAKRETEWMKDSLQLTEKQIPEVEAINLKYAKKMTELREQMQGQDRDAWRSKLEEIQKQKNEELKAVLTENQMKKYIEVLPTRRFRGQGGGNRPGGNS